MGEILQVVLPLPVPASVYGLVLLLAALNFKLVKLDDVKEVGTYLTGIFPLLFVPAAAGVMELWAEMGEMLLPILVAIIPVTVLVMVSAGKTTQALTGRKKNVISLDSGENVSPEELEKLLAPCADIQECIVKEKDKKICALIYCDPAKQDAVKEFVTGVNRGLPLYKRMVTEFSAQPLPRNAMGKLLR